MSLLGSVGRTLRRAIALCLLVAIRARRVLVPVAAVLALGYLGLRYASPARLPTDPQPPPGRAAVTAAAPSDRGVGGARISTTGVAAAGSVEAAIQQVIERADAEQAQAIASGDPSAMRDTATDAYYQEGVRTNQDLIDGGVRRIALVAIEWGPITVSGDVATAIADETWTTEYADGSTEQSRDRNVYGLVRQDGVWRVQSDEHPDATSPSPAAAGASPTGRRLDATPAPSAATAPPPATTDRARGQSSNWSGYAATGGRFTAVTGTWTVPQPTATDAGGQSAAWVGIGGERSRDLIQAGTEEIVLGPARVRYQAWIETLPQPPRQVPLGVHPGDAVTVAIAQQAAGDWLITFKNETTGATHQETVQYASSLSSAEWIQEAPTAGRRRATAALDDFESVTFSNASTVKDGQRVNLAQAGAQPITLTDRSDQALAVPSVLTADGAGFTVTRTSATPSQGRPARRG